MLLSPKSLNMDFYKGIKGKWPFYGHFPVLPFVKLSLLAGFTYNMDHSHAMYVKVAFLHTSPIEPMLKKCFISNDIVTVLKACGKHTLCDVNCYCKMTSVVALDGVTSFFSWKDITNHVNVRDTVQLFAGISSVQWPKVGRSWILQLCFCRLLSPRFFKKSVGNIAIASVPSVRPSVRPSRYLLLNHWTKSNQIWCVCCSHEWGVQRHIFFLAPPPGALGRGQKVKYH